MNENKVENGKFVQSISYLGFAADLIAVASFVYQLFQQKSVLAFSEAIPSVAVIVLVFTFSFFLLRFSKKESDKDNVFVWGFSWLYILFSALILALKSWHFFTLRPYSVGDLLGYILIVSLIFGLGFSMTFIVGSVTQRFSYPYMVIAIEQIGLWVFKVLSRTLVFDLYFVGEIFLFTYTGIIILFALYAERVLKSRQQPT